MMSAKHALLLFGLISVLAMGCKCKQMISVDYHQYEGKQMPFAEAVRVGNLLILSGQIGVDPKTDKLVQGGIEAETRQTMINIKATLEKHGLSMSKVVKCTIMLDDMSQWERMNKVYVSFFPDNLPARSTFGAEGLALGAAVEIECWASAI